ncbi:MAG: hypothetical protein R3F60_14875 [bacterium]
MSDEKGGTALSKARAEAAQAKEDLKKARSSASAARQRDREESSTALKKARSATQAARADARQARAGRLIGHVLFQACAVGSTMAGEAIGDSKLAEKLDTKVKQRAPLAVLGALAGAFGPDLGISPRVADGVSMGLMAPASVALGELAYQKVKEAGAE